MVDEAVREMVDVTVGETVDVTVDETVDVAVDIGSAARWRSGRPSAHDDSCYGWRDGRWHG